MKITEIPALKLFLLLILISIAFSLLELDITAIYVISGVSLLFSILFFIKKKLFISYFICIIGISSLLSYRINYFSEIYPTKIIPPQKALFKGEIKEILKYSEKYIRYIAVGDLYSPELPTVKNTKILLTAINPRFAALPGEYIVSDINLNFHSEDFPNSNFSFRKYLKSLEIDWNATLFSNKITITHKENLFTSTSYNIRKNIQKRIYEIFDKNSAAIVSALTTGDKSLIDAETKQNFVLSGTAHILALSGLHVGLISFIIFNLLSFINNKWMKSILSILLIFVFVYITGFLTSALRAAIMISVYIIMQNFERKINPLNSIGLAGLILFLINPNIIFSVSFQMSFLSVLGILFLYPKIYEKFTGIINNNKILNFVFSSLALTISSSILLSPLIAYYFDIFSIISPFANLLVVPLMILSLSFGIFALLMSLLSTNIAEIYALSSSFIIKISNEINKFAISFDWSYIKGDYSIWLAFFISFIIIYLIFSETNRNFMFRFIVSICLLYFAILNIPEKQNKTYEIVAKQNFSALILNKDEKSEYLLIFDRKNNNRYYKDFELSNYIKNNNKIKLIAYTGIFGNNVVDNISKNSKISNFELGIKEQKLIFTLLKLKENPSTIIEF